MRNGISGYGKAGIFGLAAIVVVGAIGLGRGHAEPPAKPQKLATPSGKSDDAVQRTRKQVQMLDDLYKTVVVYITEHYVEEESDKPAGTAAIDLFDAMREKGWHDVRLIDAAGEPIEEKNLPQDAFEKEAVRQLQQGKTHYEQVVGNPPTQLRFATPIPLVHAKCVMCHPNYKQVPEGKPVGILSYTVDIE